MAKRASSGMEVLLGLLTIEPMSGYDLKQVIQNSTRHFWSESYGQIYPNLKRMAAAGLVQAKTEKSRGKPDRRVYSITGKGRERLAEWLAREPQPEVPRNELLLKLFFGAQAAPEILIGFMERMAENERAVLQQFAAVEKEIARNRQYPDSPYWKMVLRFGQIELTAHQRWFRESLAELNKLAAKRGGAPANRKEARHAGK